MSQSTAKDGAHRELPGETDLAKAGEVMIKDGDGNQIPLKSLWTNKPENERQLIIFIRHFFCGSCKQYVEAICQDLPPSKLEAANISVSFVGCGDAVCIPGYAKETSCRFPIYTDASVQSYKLLGMMSNIRQGDAMPDYIKTSFWSNVVKSTWAAITSGHALSSGPSAQNGGEWLFQGGELKWCHRMRNSTDHTDTKELKAVLQIDN